MINNSILEQENEQKDSIAIIGFGLRFPGDSNDLDQIWKILIDKVENLKSEDFDRWNPNYYYNQDSETFKCGAIDDWKKFDPNFFGIPQEEAPFIDPQQRLLLKVAWETFEDAGIDPITKESIPSDISTRVKILNPLGKDSSVQFKKIIPYIYCNGLSPTGVDFTSQFTLEEKLDHSFKSRTNSKVLKEKEDIKQCLNIAPASLDIYKSIENNSNISYGPSFQLLEEYQILSNFIISKVGSAHSKTSRFDTGTFFNPPILDSAIQSFLPMDIFNGSL
eukprot:gene6622-8193_t